MGSLFWVWSHLWLITSVSLQTRFLAHLWRVLNHCTLAEIDYYKKVFLLHFPSQVMGSAMGDTSGKAATSFWKMSSLFSVSLWRGLLLRVVTDPPALGGLRAPLTTLSPISNREAGVLQMQQLFQKQKMKRVLKSFSQFRARKCLRTLSVDCNTACLSSLHLLFQIFSTFFSVSFLSSYFFCLSQTNIH